MTAHGVDTPAFWVAWYDHMSFHAPETEAFEIHPYRQLALWEDQEITHGDRAAALIESKLSHPSSGRPYTSDLESTI
uniref:Uncharacterized protein n=1 Tax=uncultured prokaryote TaxID=198431 RepID=A0A0H5Q5R8_9ZZZZ|nr:hypothetical protein [uncultured prokaryote]